MSIKNIIATLIVGLIVFETIEHVVFPLLWFAKNGKKKSLCGVEGLLGRVVEIMQWEKTEGRVFVNGELWSAVSDVPLAKGDKAVIEDVQGLTLRVKAFSE